LAIRARSGSRQDGVTLIPRVYMPTGEENADPDGENAMATVGLQPQPDFDVDSTGQFLTFVVPALKGCNLKCSFCLVRERREVSETRLRPEDMIRFVREAVQRAPIFALAIQGYEPLLPESLPYTQAILAIGRFLNLPTTLVTNGVRLADTVDLLRTLSPSKIAISLDAAAPRIHDRIRGVAGASAMTMAGIRKAIEVLAPQTLLAVASVLIPSRRHYLENMPARLREFGIDRWIINPLLHVGADGPGGLAGERNELFRDLMILQEAAEHAGVILTVDDEFGHLGHDAASASEPALRALRVRTLPRNVELFRLSPGGRCSTGDGVLKQEAPDMPRWRPGVMHAGDFLERQRRIA
jgi:sulfatase maturation enzyme AslB (radical SAM superfamily)